MSKPLPGTFLNETDAECVCKALLGDVLPEAAGRAPDVLEPVAHSVEWLERICLKYTYIF